MTKLFTMFIAASAFLTLASCNTTTDNKPNYLVLYYSQTGATKTVAQEFQEQLNADIEAIEVENPYNGTYQETISRCQQEIADNIVPTIKQVKANLDDYDVVFLGFPIWFGTYSRPIYGVVSQLNLKGKKVVPFCTFGSGGIEAASANLKKALPDTNILDGYGIRNARVASAHKEVERFLIENGYIKGDIKPLADYSEQVAVTDAEKELFNAACGNYQFPLGTPVTAGKRTTPDGTDYKFTVKSQSNDGTETTSIIYVTDINGTKPEFTRVVR